eukprot:3240608-Pyramimonas_sp.AAC.1
MERGKLRSATTCMQNFLKAHPDDSVNLTTSDLKEKYLIHFLVHQMRSKNTTKQIQSERMGSTNSEKIKEFYWWNKFQMNTNLGEEMAEHYRTSGKLPKVPNMVTGSTDEEHVQWGVPVNYERMTDAEWNAMRIWSTGESSEADMKAAQEFFGLVGSGSSSSGSGQASIKAEPKSELDFLNEKIEALKADPTQSLR